MIRLARYLLAALLLLSVLGSLVSCNESHKESPQEKRERIRKAVSSQLRIPPSGVSYSTRALSEVAKESLANKVMGNKYMFYADFRIVNDSAYDIKDFKISFAIEAPSGTQMRSVTSDTIYEIIPANGSRDFSPMDIAAIKIGNPSVTAAAIEDFELVGYQAN